MNKNLLKVLFCVVLLIACDYGVGSWLKKLYFKQKEGKYYDQTYAIDSIKTDVVIIGSSRAVHGYIAQTIEDSLHQSCYNAGREGAYFLHQYAVIKSITKRYHPKMIIWDYWAGFMPGDVNYLELSTLEPYYKTHPEIKEVVDLKGPYEKVKMLSYIYPFNSSLIYNLNKEVHLFKNPEKDRSIKGYVPLKRIWNEPIKTGAGNTSVNNLDTNSINAYKATIKHCKKNNIQLVVVISPYFEHYETNPGYDVLAEKIASDEHIPFFNMASDSSIISTPKNFAEPIHLNVVGAQLFTNDLIRRIKTDKNIHH